MPVLVGRTAAHLDNTRTNFDSRTLLFSLMPPKKSSSSRPSSSPSPQRPSPTPNAALPTPAVASLALIPQSQAATASQAPTPQAASQATSVQQPAKHPGAKVLNCWVLAVVLFAMAVSLTGYNAGAMPSPRGPAEAGMPPPESAQSDCSDGDSDCAEWAAAGHCSSELQPGVRLSELCGASCRRRCKDTDSNCAEWAAGGFCDEALGGSPDATVRDLCCVSCGGSGSGGGSGGGGGDADAGADGAKFAGDALSCSDGYSDCAEWAAAGHCSSELQPGVRLSEMCCASCRRHCKDTDSHCAEWAAAGHCTQQISKGTTLSHLCCASCHGETPPVLD